MSSGPAIGTQSTHGKVRVGVSLDVSSKGMLRRCQRPLLSGVMRTLVTQTGGSAGLC